MMKGGGRDRELGKRTVKSQTLDHVYGFDIKKGKGRPYSTTERRVPELIQVLGSQSACR